MGFSRQGYWSGLPFPSPGDLPHPGIEPRSPTLQADALTSEPPGKKEFPPAAVVKTVLLRAQVSIPGSGRSPGGANSNPLHYFCLENPMDSGAWQAIDHVVTKSQTQLKQLGTQHSIAS